MKKLYIPLVLILGLASFSVPALAGDAKAGKAKTAVCAGCHGSTGNSAITANPKLNGQNEAYIAKQLKDFKSGDRKSPIMGGMVGGLSEKDMANIGAYFAAQKTQIVAAPAVSADEIAIGERIYRAGNEETGVPACIGCHGPKGNGNVPAGWPKLSGQHADYVVTQLKAFREAAQYPEDANKGRRNDGDGKIMRDVTAHMSDRELKAVAAYVQGLH